MTHRHERAIDSLSLTPWIPGSIRSCALQFPETLNRSALKDCPSREANMQVRSQRRTLRKITHFRQLRQPKPQRLCSPVNELSLGTVSDPIPLGSCDAARRVQLVDQSRIFQAKPRLRSQFAGRILLVLVSHTVVKRVIQCISVDCSFLSIGVQGRSLEAQLVLLATELRDISTPERTPSAP